MSKLKIETGSSPAEERFSITVTEKGPFLVYGRPPLAEQFIIHMKTALCAGILCASYSLYQLFRFVSPALYVN
jgi:Sec-independent protein secretion pathway component TatC